MPLLLDTGPFAMVLMNSPRLTKAARSRIVAERSVSASVISLYEIAQKVRLGKWDEVAHVVPRLEARSEASGIEIVGLNAKLALDAALIDWPHRDPCDRMIAATAIDQNLALVSPDAAFDSLGIDRVWD